MTLNVNNMMPRTYDHSLKTGGDPRVLPDYAALRDELSKLTHPARPDINWPYAEKLSLALFDINGVELQTAAWYTEIRTHLAGINGLNEGLAILNALIRYQWSTVWPQDIHARIEILRGLSQRLQRIIRTFKFQSGDLSALYQAEKALVVMGELLQQPEIRHSVRTDVLRQMIQNAAIRLENSEGVTQDQREKVSEGVVLPVSAISKRQLNAENGKPQCRVYVAEPLAATTDMARRPAGLWKAFAGGVLITLVLCGLACQAIPVLFSQPEKTQLMASVAPLPAVLPPKTITRLHQEVPGWLEQNKQYQRLLDERLDELASRSPFWSASYGSQLIQQTRKLYPDSSLADNATRKWRQQLVSNAMPPAGLDSWHKGMTELQRLQDKLNRLDEKKGSYMTVSELKSAIFSVVQAFNENIPAEEYLRQLSQIPENEGVSPALLTQTDMQLRQLTDTYLLFAFQSMLANH